MVTERGSQNYLLIKNTLQLTPASSDMSPRQR
jgi:hypothetical protein